MCWEEVVSKNIHCRHMVMMPVQHDIKLVVPLVLPRTCKNSVLARFVLPLAVAKPV
jgi:hypothetical protein